MSAEPQALLDYLPARIGASADLPWIPSSMPGKFAKPLRFLADDRGFVELLRMEPGLTMPLHRHTGEIHAYNLSGTRQLCTGELIGPGDYVYEPAGNVDWWKIVGDEPMVALVVVMGAVEFLGPGGTVRFRATAETQRAEYERHCREHRRPILDLSDR
ncbi:cupin domain-containing protein [Lysobacter sp. CA199]|uniref:cupin domain-containing protein n=1 Tax=Lysobacter sp. CA199 TaxID=3455608 RepID=UPI003F8D3100